MYSSPPKQLPASTSTHKKWVTGLDVVQFSGMRHLFQMSRLAMGTAGHTSAEIETDAIIDLLVNFQSINRALYISARLNK